MLEKDFVYTNKEKMLNKVLKSQRDRLDKLSSDSDTITEGVEASIKKAEEALISMGYGRDVADLRNSHIKRENAEQKFIVVRTWEEISKESNMEILVDVSIKDFFSADELVSNKKYLVKLRDDFNSIHRLDPIDYTICGIAGVLAAAVDLLLVGIPKKTNVGIEAGYLSNYIRKKMEEALPPEEMIKLGNSKAYKVPFDPQDNRNLSERVEGLSSWFHRFHSLGHDPLLGFIFGVIDIMQAKFTAIDVGGNLISQAAPNQSTKGMELFDAISLVFRHMKSDVTTSMGLPVPLMTLMNLMQFGKIGDQELSIAQIVRGMYAEGYDFTHFLSMSVSPMLIEVLVRTAYFGKRMYEGYGFTDALPMDIPFDKKPKLGTMLFIAHSITTAINAGKVAFTENPLAVNYTQWLSFAKHSISQLKWVLFQKPALCNKYVQGFIDNEWEDINSVLECSWKDFSRDAIILNS